VASSDGKNHRIFCARGALSLSGAAPFPCSSIDPRVRKELLELLSEERACGAGASIFELFMNLGYASLPVLAGLGTTRTGSGPFASKRCDWLR
jgi:hypothetical protein